LLTGCRYSELAAVRAADFNPDAGMVTAGSAANIHASLGIIRGIPAYTLQSD
jgi:hypothetical protein